MYVPCYLLVCILETSVDVYQSHNCWYSIFFLVFIPVDNKTKRTMHHNNGKKAVRYLSFLVTRCQKTITTTPMKRRERGKERKKTVSLHQWKYCTFVHGMFVYRRETEILNVKRRKKHASVLTKQWRLICIQRFLSLTRRLTNRPIWNPFVFFFICI